MTYTELINRFWQLDNELHFTAAETRLYLMMLDNLMRVGLDRTITWTNGMASEHLGISINAYLRARDTLVTRGLLAVEETPGRGRRSHRTTYRLPASVEKLASVDQHAAIDNPAEPANPIEPANSAISRAPKPQRKPRRPRRQTDRAHCRKLHRRLRRIARRRHRPQRCYRGRLHFRNAAPLCWPTPPADAGSGVNPDGIARKIAGVSGIMCNLAG